MLEARSAVHATATGSLAAGPSTLVGAVLTAAAATATAVVRTGGASGAVVLTLSAVANTSAVFAPAAAIGAHDLHVTLTGAGVTFTAYI
jgi:hypothetical protein